MSLEEEKKNIVVSFEDQICRLRQMIHDAISIKNEENFKLKDMLAETQRSHIND